MSDLYLVSEDGSLVRCKSEGLALQLGLKKPDGSNDRHEVAIIELFPSLGDEALVVTPIGPSHIIGRIKQKSLSQTCHLSQSR